MHTNKSAANKGIGYKRVLRVAAFAVAALVAWSIKSMFGTGWIFFAVMFIIAYILASFVAVAIGTVIGGVKSGKRQAASLKESAASGSEELLALDKARLKVQLANAGFYLLIALVIVWVAVSYIGNGAPPVVQILLGVAAIIAAGVAKTPLTSRFKTDFKEQIVRKGLESVLDDMDYQPDMKLDESIIKETHLFAEYDRYTGNDYLTANYNEKPFTMSDVHLEVEREETYTDDDGDTHTRTYYETIFRGRLMVVDYDAISNEPVFVRARFGRRRTKGVTEAEMDAFNRRFIIEAEDAVAALRILTPQVQTGIIDASDKLGCPMSLAFLNDKLYIAVWNGDAFEAKTGGDKTLTEQRQMVRDDIQAVLDLVESIYINNMGGNI